MLYKKKPVLINAIQFTGTNIDEIKNFMGDALICKISSSTTPLLFIKTLEGNMLVSINDYVIKGVNGEFYPCKPDIFKKTYESYENNNKKFNENVKVSDNGYEILNIAQELHKYETAKADGRLLISPVKVGTHIYILHRSWIDEGEIVGIAECDDFSCFCFKVYEDPDTYTLVALDDFNKTWFIEEEKANKML